MRSSVQDSPGQKNSRRHLKYCNPDVRLVTTPSRRRRMAVVRAREGAEARARYETRRLEVTVEVIARSFNGNSVQSACGDNEEIVWLSLTSFYGVNKIAIKYETFLPITNCQNRFPR